MTDATSMFVTVALGIILVASLLQLWILTLIVDYLHSLAVVLGHGPHEPDPGEGAHASVATRDHLKLVA